MSDEIWLERDGIRLFAIARGAGDPIVLLHGGLANHLACGPYALPLAARFRVVTPDLRGSGRSIVGHGAALTWDVLADDVAAWVRQLAASRVVIGGVSFGSGVAARVALRHPGMVAGLVLIHPVYGGSDVGLTPAQAAAMYAMDVAGQRCLVEGPSALYPLFDPLPDEIRARARAMAAGFDPASIAITTRFLASGEQPFATASELASIDAPALLIPGLDATHPREISDLYERNLRHVTVCSVETLRIAEAIAALVDDRVNAAPHHAAP